MFSPRRFHIPQPHREDEKPSEPGCELTRLLLKVAEPMNISHRSDRVEIALGTDWPQLLSDCRVLGSCLTVTRNSCAVLGRIGGCHALTFSADRRHAQAHCGAVDLDFHLWHSAAVVAEEREDAVAHFIEFRDVSGGTLHRICLTKDSRAQALVDWVARHQAAGNEPSAPPPSLARCGRTIQQRDWLDYDEVEEVSTQTLMDLWIEAHRQSLSVCCLVGNEGVIQTAELVPQNIRPSHDWTFVSNDTVGLHFDPEGLSSVVVHRLLAQSAHPAMSVLKCFDAQGTLCLALTPTGPSTSAWDDFINQATK